MNKKETQFARGFYFNDPHEKAPSYVVGNIALKKDEVITWLAEQKENEYGYIKVNVLRSKKDNKPYCVLDTYKPQPATQAEQAQTINEGVDEIPF